MTDSTILIVEDNPVNVLVLRSYLRKRGFEPLVAHDGSEGVQMAEAHRPRLILMDLYMPQMDGFAATEAIRSTAWGTEPAIVAVTANPGEDQRRACEAAGFSGMLAKPLNFGDLMAAVDRWVGEA